MVPKPKIAALTSLRFFAAFYVVLYHICRSNRQIVLFHENPYLPLKTFTLIGFTAVSFFFVLSGYILAIVYLQNGSPVKKKKFWLARFARIYPLFAVSLLLDLPRLFLMLLAQHGWHTAVLNSSVVFAGNLVMLQAWIPQANVLNNPVWSLSVETVFYLLFPIIGWRLWKLSAKRAGLVVLALYAAGMALLWIALHWTATRSQPDLYIYTLIMRFNPLFHLHEFFIGILLARWHTLQLRLPDLQTRLRRLAPSIVAAAVLLFGSMVYLVERFPSMYLGKNLVYLNDGLLLPVFILMIIGFGSGNSFLDRIFSVSWLVVLGEASYGLYLIHLPIYSFWERAGLEKHVWLSPLYLLIVIGLSVLSFYRFETPARKWILRRAHSHSKETLMASSAAQ